MRTGSIIFVEIPVRDLQRAAHFYAGMFGWTFEQDAAESAWFFTAPGGGPMGSITTDRSPARDGVHIAIAVNDVRMAIDRAISLGGGTAGTEGSGHSDVGEWVLLNDPDGNRFMAFHATLGGRNTRHRQSGAHDVG